MLLCNYSGSHNYILHYIQLADKNDNIETKESCKDLDPEASFFVDEIEPRMVECNLCPETFSNNHAFIKHLLKSHCVYTGLICPYCRDAHHPQRFIDLQAHVTNAHMDKLTGYGICNECKLCKKSFVGYAELRDHVQTHGDMFREPAPNRELYKENARRKRRERRIDKQKQKQLAKKHQIFEAAKAINNNLSRSKYEVLRKVTNEELSANKIRRLETGQFVIDDRFLLAKSLVHINEKKNGTKKLLVPIKLNKELENGVTMENGAYDGINMKEPINPESTMEQINFDDHIIQNEFGMVKVKNFFDEPTVLLPIEKELEQSSPSKSKNGEIVADLNIMEPSNKEILDCPPPPPPPPNTPSPAKRERLQNDIYHLSSTLRENDSSDDDQGETGIIVINDKSENQRPSVPGEMGDGSRNKLIPVYFDRNLQPVLEMNNTAPANLLRAINFLKENNQNKNFAQNPTSVGNNVLGGSTNIIPCKESVMRKLGNLCTRKKDLVLTSTDPDESFEQQDEEKHFRKCKVKTEECSEEDEIHLNNSFDTSMNSISSQTAVAEKFQQISSPFSVAALLAAAELDEELTSHTSDHE